MFYKKNNLRFVTVDVHTHYLKMIFSLDKFLISGNITNDFILFYFFITGQAQFSVNNSLRHVLQALVRFCGDIVK